MEIRKNLGKLRCKAGLSQEQLAEKLSVSRQTISKWENGATYPSTEHIFRLAEVLGCNLSELVGAETDGELNCQKSDSATDGGWGRQKSDSETAARSRSLGWRPGFWLTNLAMAGLVMLVGWGVATINSSVSRPSSALETAQLAVFNEVAEGFVDTALQVENAQTKSVEKKIVGYGIAEADSSFYIKCRLEAPESEAPYAAIVYLCEENGEYSYKCQFPEDPEFRPAGEYYAIG